MKKTFFIKTLFFFALFSKIALLLFPTSFRQSLDWLIPIFVSVFYILICSVVLVSGKSLAEFNIDSTSLVIFISFGTFLRYDTIESNTLGIILKIMVWIMMGVLLIKILRGDMLMGKPTRREFFWMSIGLFSGILLSWPIAYITVHQPGFRLEHIDTSIYTSMNFILRTLALGASNAAIPEEFVFRAVMTGYLTDKLGDQRKALFIQALMFWLVHIDRLFVSPISFFFIIPTSTLLFTILFWRSRSLSPSILAHTTLNTFQVVFAIVIANRNSF